MDTHPYVISYERFNRQLPQVSAHTTIRLRDALYDGSLHPWIVSMDLHNPHAYELSLAVSLLAGDMMHNASNDDISTLMKAGVVHDIDLLQTLCHDKQLSMKGSIPYHTHGKPNEEPVIFPRKKALSLQDIPRDIRRVLESSQYFLSDHYTAQPNTLNNLSTTPLRTNTPWLPQAGSYLALAYCMIHEIDRAHRRQVDSSELVKRINCSFTGSQDLLDDAYSHPWVKKMVQDPKTFGMTHRQPYKSPRKEIA